MANIVQVIRKPIIWLYVSVIYIWIFIIFKFIASVGPPFVIAKIADTDDSLSLAELKKAFMIYIHEASEKIDISSQFILYSMLSNIILIAPVLIIGFFVLKKKLWARNSFIILLIFFMLLPILISLASGAFPSATVVLNYDTAIYLLIIFFLTRKSTKELFYGKELT